MAEVPDRQCPCRMDRRGRRLHVEEATGAVVDVGEDDEGHLVGQGGRESGGHFGVIDEADLPAVAELLGQALEHVDVGGEVLPLSEDDAASRSIGGLDLAGGRGDLEQVDRSRVGDDGGPGTAADEARDLVAEHGGQVEPAGVVPRADQTGPPLLGDDVLGTLCGPLRSRAPRELPSR